MGHAPHPERANVTSGIFTADRLGLRVGLLMVAFSGAAWVASYFLMNTMPVSMGEPGLEASTGPALPLLASMQTMFASIEPGFLVFFTGVWVVGMVAMMFPAMIPVVAIYNHGYAKSEHGSFGARLVGTPLFLSGYLLLYAGLGVLAFFGVFLTVRLGALLPGLGAFAAIAASGTLIAAGVWQVTPLKDACLRHCVSPMGFFFIHAKSGLSGALRMGLAHGYYCVGCCWLYMLVMLAVGAMSLPAMAILAAVISVEKVLVRGARWYTLLVAGGFLAAGALTLFFPALLFGPR